MNHNIARAKAVLGAEALTVLGLTGLFIVLDTQTGFKVHGVTPSLLFNSLVVAVLVAVPSSVAFGVLYMAFTKLGGGSE